MNYKSRLLMTALIGLFLSACTPKATDTSDDVPTNVPNNDTSTAIDDNVFDTGYTAEGLRRLGIEGNPLKYKVVFFEYNSTVIDERSRVIIGAHARHLQQRSGVAVRLEGHADERGTRDYNLALGERRANEVSGLLKSNGASNTIQTISYGEEKPVDSAHNEAAWQKNRRVEISY